MTEKRPYNNPKWCFPTKVIRVPAIYADALLALALQWQSATEEARNKISSR